MPVLLHYFVTYRCNARCSFCDIWLRPDRKSAGDADGRDVLQNLKEARRLGASFVDFTGGEPLLVRDLPRWLKAAKSLGYWTSVTTNCILYPSRAKEFRGLVDLLHFSLDSAEPAVHDRLRGVSCHDRVMESLDIARGLGERPDLLITVTPETMDQVEPMIEMARRLRLMLILNPEFPYFGRTDIKAFDLDRLDRWGRLPYVYLNMAVLEMIRRGGNDAEDPRCRAVRSTIVISPDNRLLLPCFHHEADRVPIDGDLVAAFRSPVRKKALWNEGRLPDCQGCTISCYLDPSFLYRLDRLFWRSLLSKARYGYYKYVLPAYYGRRPAAPPASTRGARRP